jgi:hypothetical protein
MSVHQGKPGKRKPVIFSKQPIHVHVCNTEIAVREIEKILPRRVHNLATCNE